MALVGYLNMGLRFWLWRAIMETMARRGCLPPRKEPRNGVQMGNG
jgi:hypothetical protein